MKSVQVTRRSTARRRVLAAGALSAIVGLASIDSALAACAAGQYVAVTGGVGACADCALNTWRAASDNEASNTATYCDQAAADHYISSAATGSAHAVVTACPTNSGVAAGSQSAVTACLCKNGYALGASHADGNACVACSTAGTTPSSAPSVSGLTGNPLADGKVCDGVANNYYGAAGTATSGSQTAPTTAPNQCPPNTQSTTGSNANLATCTTKPGYYISASSGATGTAGTVTAAPAGYHAAGGVAVDTRTANEVWNGYADSFSSATGSALTQCTAGTYSAATAATSSATCTACTATFSNAGHAGSSFTSDAASTSSSDCVTKAGFYIQTPSSTAANVIVKAVPANKYSLGGASLTATSDTKLKDCPTGFTNSAGAGTARETCKKTVSASATGTTDTYTTSTNTELIACPEGTINDPAPTAGIPSFCWKTAAGYYGAQGTKGIAAAQPQGPCPANSNSPAGSTDMTACTCNSGYSLAVAAGDFTCVADTPTASTPTAAEESAGAAMPIAAAVAAMAMPLLI